MNETFLVYGLWIGVCIIAVVIIGYTLVFWHKLRKRDRYDTETYPARSQIEPISAANPLQSVKDEVKAGYQVKPSMQYMKREFINGTATLHYCDGAGTEGYARMGDHVRLTSIFGKQTDGTILHVDEEYFTFAPDDANPDYDAPCYITYAGDTAEILFV